MNDKIILKLNIGEKFEYKKYIIEYLKKILIEHYIKLLKILINFYSNYISYFIDRLIRKEMSFKEKMLYKYLPYARRTLNILAFIVESLIGIPPIYDICALIKYILSRLYLIVVASDITLRYNLLDYIITDDITDVISLETLTILHNITTSIMN